MVLELQYAAPQSVIDAIGSLGRTEDVRFSPSNRRLAVASFYRNRVVVFDVDIASSSGATQVALTGGVELSSSALQWPHGVDFLDDDTLIVTSRGRDVAFFELPPGNRDVPSLEVLPIARWPSDRTTLLNAPGSVAVSHVGDDGCEVLICNNDGHTVTRHLLDCDAGRAVRHSEILLQKYLDIPGRREREPGSAVDRREQPYHPPRVAVPELARFERERRAGWHTPPGVLSAWLALQRRWSPSLRRRRRSALSAHLRAGLRRVARRAPSARHREDHG